MASHLGRKRGKLITPKQRQMAIENISEAIEQGARQSQACEVIGIAPRTVQRWLKTGLEDRRQTVIKTPANKLKLEEKAKIIEICNSPEFSHQSPKQIVPALADIGIYIASESSFYRTLHEQALMKHRGRTVSPVVRYKPTAYVAESPNQIWSWDITYLSSAVKGLFFYLYLIMDIYSRKIVGWEIYDHQSADLASEVLEKTRLSEALLPGHKIVLHADNGGPMKGATMVATMDRLGVIPSFSRPSVSNDNPYSEALFKTLKYVPSYPGKPFESIENARVWVLNFVRWYNQDHRHSSIKHVTPVQRHTGEDIAILEQRRELYEQARKKHPERWSGDTRNWQHEAKVKLNPHNEGAAEQSH